MCVITQTQYVKCGHKAFKLKFCPEEVKRPLEDCEPIFAHVSVAKELPVVLQNEGCRIHTATPSPGNKKIPGKCDICNGLLNEENLVCIRGKVRVPSGGLCCFGSGDGSSTSGGRLGPVARPIMVEYSPSKQTSSRPRPESHSNPQSNLKAYAKQQHLWQKPLPELPIPQTKFAGRDSHVAGAFALLPQDDFTHMFPSGAQADSRTKQRIAQSFAAIPEYSRSKPLPMRRPEPWQGPTPMQPLPVPPLRLPRKQSTGHSSMVSQLTEGERTGPWGKDPVSPMGKSMRSVQRMPGVHEQGRSQR